MPRKKVIPEENPEQVSDMEMEPQIPEEGVEGLEQPSAGIPQEAEAPPDSGEELSMVEGLNTVQTEAATALPEPEPLEEVEDAPEEASAMKPFWMEPSDSPPPPPPPDPEPTPQKSDRQSFYDLDFNALDRGLTAEERQEWNSIYASYRGRSALTGTIIAASRRLAARSQRYFFAHREALNRTGAQVKCRVLSVGPRRCLVECYGHDINLTQRELRYTAIPDLREEYHPGEELDCVVTSFDPDKDELQISVKATQSNPFDGAEQRHPVGSRRYATIAGKYGGGVFCNLPDGTVCMCNYSYQHEDSDFMVGDTVIVLVQRFEESKRQMYGKIMSKW